jgi:hypothetical protein
VVPLFPQSSACMGGRRPRKPSPLIRISPDSSGIAAPSARNTPAVDRTSSESRMPATRDSPSARQARISERCEIDLSPGTLTAPETVNEAKTLAPSPRPFFRRGTSR